MHTRKFILTTPLLALGLLTGCQTYTAKSADYQNARKANNIQATVDEAGKKAADNKGGRDAIVWQLENAATLRTAALANLTTPPTPPKGLFGGSKKDGPPEVMTPTKYLTLSNDAFDRAHERITQLSEEAKTQVGKETAAMFTNLATIPYRGTGYDKVMLHTYSAANYLQLGDKEKARVALNRVLQSQRDGLEDHARQIAEAEKAAEKQKNVKEKDKSYDVADTMKEEKLTNELKGMEIELNAKLRTYEAYVNPLSVWLDGLYFATNAADASDLEHARKSFERVAGMHPENTYLKADLEMAQNLTNGQSPTGLTYVVFETGAVAAKTEWKIDIPMFVFNQRLPNVVIALPRLKFDPAFVPSITVSTGGQEFTTALLCDMDAVVAQEFKNDWNATLTKSLISTAVKAGTDAAAAKYNRDHGNTATQVFSILVKVTNYATTIADTRSWTALPKQFQYCRLNTPADHLLQVTVEGTTQPVQLGDGQVNLVWVKSIGPGTVPYIFQSSL